MLKRTVRNYLILTAFAVAGAFMAMQAKSAVRSAANVQPYTARIVVETQRGIDGVIEVEGGLAIREGPREPARADRDAGVASESSGAR